MKVAIYSSQAYEKPIFEAAKPEGWEVRYLKESLSKSTVSLSSGCEAVVLFVNDDGSEQIIDLLYSQGLRYLILRSAGYDNVNLNAAKKLGIKVANVPKYPPYAVAEMSVALMLALNRHIIDGHSQIANFDFRLDGLMGFNLHGKTVGIIGLGNIGQALARIMNGFGCKLLGYDPKPKADFVTENLVEFVSMETLLKESTIVSLHAPLNEKTKYMINEATIAQMQDGVMLINAGRGGLVDTKAALAGMKSGKIGYLGLDVYEKEKGVFINDRSSDKEFDSVLRELTQHPNVILTSHQGFFTQESLDVIIATVYSNLQELGNNQECPNELA